MTIRPVGSLTKNAQRDASDPAASAWVSANAGSGKTHVLSQRVVRLLLARVPPSRILCLTYTKAAAANMSARIFDVLARWALLDDESLIREIEATGADRPSRAELNVARCLFARAVETPGGLKIQTIHAFCEKLLHHFPFEANAPAGFRVIDDMERAELLEASKRRALDCAMRDSGALRHALEHVARETSGFGFDNLCDELLGNRDALAQFSDRETYALRLRARLGLRAEETLARIEKEIVEGGEPWPDWPALAKALRGGSSNDGKLADSLERAYALAPHPDCIDIYLSAFYTQKGEPRGAGKTKIITAGLVKGEPGLLERMEEERDRLAPLIEKRKAAATAERSMALMTLGDAIVTEYSRAKRYRNLLDYDDLIEGARRLLQRSSPSWVLYKLDSQIDHILLDEAQDTSAAQWDILTAIADEFCAGDGARHMARTFFAVGDEKQSIFSFQGAAPEKFDAMRRDFERRFRTVERLFRDVRLLQSFRSAKGILEAVDMVFGHAGNGAGLASDPLAGMPKHEAWKTDVQALVEIWEPIGSQNAEEPADWRLPLDYVEENDPAERLAGRVARKIKTLLAPDSGECVEDKGRLRPVEAGDILILVRKRGPFFEALIRALKAEHVPVAGADRLDLADHIAVNDLVALGRAALLVEDDLTLATVLKSPLIGFDDDDLISLAPRRTGSLFSALKNSGDERHRHAAQTIDAWRRDAATLAPFDFYGRILGPGGGRTKLVARLGAEANDAIDEFLRLALTFEREQAPSLTSFLAMVETLDLSIKRDMEAAGAAVRVMTAHAAKGLEAKIVFLPDTCGAPAGKHDPKLFRLGEDDDVSLVWSLDKASDPAALGAARARHRDAERAEHQRLLYVALTRAEERLYIAGYHGSRGPADGCWYNAIRDALEPACNAFADPFEPEGAILRLGEVPPRHDLARTVARESLVEIPAFAHTAARREIDPAPPLRPSSALAGADAFASGAAAAPNRRDAERVLEGRLTHALLQHLPTCAEPRRRAAAERFLALRGEGLDDARRNAIAQAALAVIEDPGLADLFGPQSAAEVDIVAALDNGLFVSGRIDRLAETENEVLIADFKTGRAREAPEPDQLRQLALYRAAIAPLYPGKRLRCFLVWTQTATAMEAQDAALDAAFERARER
ncbi:double-strand break repair helicase AddA [Methylocystis sp. ATCC 49242]|uniref:double-strand break repair helicase AddA n=1 Tax=Methylocystis sp. ATCC 49242 TaxID=622637 RepID=UPI0001F86D00|nr:double-strand break repair helicase AddA [Methylocystis sp. ATCC 49242]